MKIRSVMAILAVFVLMATPLFSVGASANEYVEEWPVQDTDVIADDGGTGHIDVFRWPIQDVYTITGDEDWPVQDVCATTHSMPGWVEGGWEAALSDGDGGDNITKLPGPPQFAYFPGQGVGLCRMGGKIALCHFEEVMEILKSVGYRDDMVKGDEGGEETLASEDVGSFWFLSFIVSEVPTDREVFGLYGVEDFLSDEDWPIQDGGGVAMIILQRDGTPIIEWTRWPIQDVYTITGDGDWPVQDFWSWNFAGEDYLIFEGSREDIGDGHWTT